MKTAKHLKHFIQFSTIVLERLDAWLPPLSTEPDWSAQAYRFEKIGNKGALTALPRPHTFPLVTFKIR